MEKIYIGKVVNAVGLRGEIKVYNYSENHDRFETIEQVLIGDEKKTFTYDIESVRYKAHMVILKLRGIDDRNKSEELKGQDVFMRESDLEELPQGVYYVKDMLGMKVISDEGVELGKLKDVIAHTPQKLYVVERDGKGDILIPGVDEFILNIDIEKGKITVKVIEGLYED